MNNLSRMKMCIEKQIPKNIHILNNIKSTASNTHQLVKTRAAFYSSKKWAPGTTIKIKFLSPPPNGLEKTPLNYITNPDPLQLEVNNIDIQTAIRTIVQQRLNSYMGLKLVFVDPSQPAQIRITFDPNGGAWSYIGTDCLSIAPNEPTMNLGWFDVATVIHEFGHALGMIHEHQNPFGNPIQWDLNAVYAWAQQTQGWDQQTAYDQIIAPYEITQVNGSTFDPNSIMLYFFPASLTKNNQGTKENSRLSPNDVIYLNQQYPVTGSNCGAQICQTPQEFYKSAYNFDISSPTIYTPTYPLQTVQPTIYTPTYPSQTVQPSIYIPTYPLQTVQPTIYTPTYPSQTVQPSIYIPTSQSTYSPTSSTSTTSNPDKMLIIGIIVVIVIFVLVILGRSF